MKFIGVRDFRNKSGKLWEELSSEKEIIITSNGKPIAVLSSISESDLEETLKIFRRIRAMLAVDKLQTNSVLKGKNRLTMNDINVEIKAVRKNRKR